MTRSQSESQEHHNLIIMMVHYFESQGYKEIKADIPERKRPTVIYGTKKNHIPDLTARKNGNFVILEVETASTIFDSHTASQWSLFADAANNAGGEFHVVVPKGAKSIAEQRASNLRINVNTIWTPK